MIGIRLDGSALIVIFNCSLLDFITLESAVDPLSLTNVIANVYESQAIVVSSLCVSYFSALMTFIACRYTLY